MFSSTKYLGVTVTHGDSGQYIVQIYDMTRPDDELDVRVCDRQEAIGLVSLIVRTHDPRLCHSQAELEYLVGLQLTHLEQDPTMRATMWLPPELVPDGTST